MFVSVIFLKNRYVIMVRNMKKIIVGLCALAALSGSVSAAAYFQKYDKRAGQGRVFSCSHRAPLPSFSWLFQTVENIDDENKVIGILQEHVRQYGSRYPLSQIKGSSDQSLLHAAAMRGRGHVAGYLISEAGCDVNAQDNKDATPLHYAAMGGHDDLINTWLYHPTINLDIFGLDKDRKNALHWAVSRGKIDTIDTLLNYVARYDLQQFDSYLNFQNLDGLTPLFIAVHHNYINMVDNLIKRGAQVNIFDRMGLFPIHYAAAMGYCELVIILNQASSSLVNVKCFRHGCEPIAYAQRSGHQEVVAYLKEQVESELLKKYCPVIADIL
jgi:ankyrin repeat protein